MAKTTIWTGNSSGAPAVAGNWSNGVPVATDTVIIDGNTTVNMDADPTTFAAVKFALWFIGPDATIDMGTGFSSGETIRFAATKIVHQGTGTFYYFYSDHAVEKTNEIVINSTNRILAANLLCNFYQTDILTITSGRVTTTGVPNIVTNLYISYRSASLTDAVVQGQALFAATLHMNGGTVAFDIPPAVTHINGGALTVNSQSGGGGRAVYIGGNAKLIYNDNVTIDLLEMRSGSLDLTQNSRELTITTMRRWPGTTLKTNELVTITNDEDMTGDGPRT